MVDLSSDQDTTDLTKCLMYLDARIGRSGGGGGGSGAGGGESGGSSGGCSEEEARRLRSEHAIIVLGEGGSVMVGVVGCCRLLWCLRLPSLSTIPGLSKPPSQPTPKAGSTPNPEKTQPNPKPGALGGRLDHIIAHLNNLYAFPHLDITLCGDGNLVRLLPRGRSVVRPHPRLEGPTCGLVPLAAPTVCSSQGLEWNMEDTEVRAVLVGCLALGLVVGVGVGVVVVACVRSAQLKVKHTCVGSDTHTNTPLNPQPPPPTTAIRCASGASSPPPTSSWHRRSR